MPLSSCGPPRPDFGIDAIAPNGAQVTIAEHQIMDATLKWNLILLDLQNNRHTTLTEAFTPSHSSSFSPDGNYVLFVEHGKWLVMHVNTEHRFEVASLEEKGRVEFLPSGELLVISSTGDGLYQLEIVSDPANPQETEVYMENVRYIFPGQPSDLSDYAMNAFSPSCPEPPALDQKVWITVNDKNVVTLLLADYGGPSKRKLTNLSANLADLLEGHEKMLEELIRSEFCMPEVEAQAEANKPLSEEDLEKIEECAQTMLSQTLGGIPSPNGMKLLFVRINAISDYTLYLIDLETQSDEILSSETDWIPYFSFSPDGEQILFESNLAFDSAYAGERGLYIANSDATNIRRLDVPEASVPCWHR